MPILAKREGDGKMPKGSRVFVVEFFMGEKKVGTLTIGRTLKATGAGLSFQEYAISYGGRQTAEATYESREPSVSAWKSNRRQVEEELKEFGGTMREFS